MSLPALLKSLFFFLPQQELNSKPDKDDAAIQELLREIADINQSQREELNLVREAESNYTPQDDDGGHQEEPKDEEEEKEDVDDDDDRSLPSPYGPILGEEEDEIPEEPMDWEDLTREQWTETDKLLQKIERAGSRVIQQDFMSSVGMRIISFSIQNDYKSLRDFCFFPRTGPREQLQTSGRGSGQAEAADGRGEEDHHDRPLASHRHSKQSDEPAVQLPDGAPRDHPAEGSRQEARLLLRSHHIRRERSQDAAPSAPGLERLLQDLFQGLLPRLHGHLQQSQQQRQCWAHQSAQK